jgi:hypothetical protein
MTDPRGELTESYAGMDAMFFPWAEWLGRTGIYCCTAVSPEV